MHILQMLPALAVGGVERGVLDSAKGLIARGHRVSVISSGGPLVERLTRLGAAHHTLPVHDKSARALTLIPQVMRIIRDTQVDLVHARSRVPGWIGFAAARLTQRPFITTAHGFYTPHLGSRVMLWGRTVIAPSEALGRYLVQELGLPKARLRVIPRGIDLEEFTYRASEPPQGRPWRIGVIGRFSPIKGQDVAIRACAELIKRGHPVRLCLAGDAPEAPLRTTLESLAASLGIEHAIEWLGVQHDVPALLASLDVVLVPSTYPESFGRGVVEAQAVGRPVIAAASGALAELVRDGETGLLVPPRDPVALAGAVERVLRDAPLRARLVRAARAEVDAERSVDRMVDRTLMVYEECVTKPRIAIWKLSALGDVILATPSLRAIRKRWPSAHLTLIVGRAAYEVVAQCPYLDDIIIYDKRGKDRGPAGHVRFIRRLREAAFDWSIDLQNSRATHLMAWLAQVPVRIGFRRKFGWLLNAGVRLPKVVLSPIAHQHHLLRSAGIAPDGETLELWPTAQDDAAVSRLLEGADPARPLVALHPGGSGRWRTKRWDPDRWIAVARALTQQQMQVVLLGGPDEAQLGERFLAQAPGARNLIGKTSLLELASLLTRCRLFLGHDSSLLHIAAAVGTPAVALFGPTDPRRHVPSTLTGQVLRKDVWCSPCYSPRCRTLTHACMRRIGTDEVLAAALGILAPTAAQP